MEVIKPLFIMCICTVLKSALKAALPTGRIRQQQWRIHDPTPKGPNGEKGLLPDFSMYTRPLSPDEWIIFQHEERSFRRSLDTKRLETGHNFVFTGETPDKWIKIIRILNGL